MLLALLAAIFSVLGLALSIAAVLTQTWVLLVGLLFLGVGVVMAWFVPETRREQNADLRDPPPASADTVPFARVAELVRERLAGSPYAVELEGSRIRVHADLADATFLGWASAHHVKVVRGLEIVAKSPGLAITRDFEQDFEVRLGIGRLSGRARVQSGRSWSYERRIEIGVGADGTIGRQVDVDFSSADLKGPVNAVLEETGWKAGPWASLPAEAKGAAIVAGIAAGGGLVTGVVLGIGAILGKFG